MTHPALDTLGKLLVHDVRQQVIDQWRRVADGSFGGAAAAVQRRKLDALPPQAKALLLELLPDVVDSVLHELLAAIEEHDDVQFIVRTADSNIDVRDVSDGLAGELYGRNGWIRRFESHDPNRKS